MKNILFISLILIPLLAGAQEFNYIFEPDSIPVEVEGWNPFCPFSGGDSQTTPELCDIDNDGDLDFFWGNYGGKVSFFENKGTNTESDYELITKDFAGVNIGGSPYYGRTGPVFVDIDGDGDYDLLSSCGKGLVHYWENIGNPSEPEFQWITDSLEYIDVPGQSSLDLVDIDCDQDFDLFYGDNLGHIQYFRNIGTAQNFDLELVTSQFESISFDENTAPCFADIDNDHDYDLFIGAENGRICYYRNDGDSANYDFTYVTDNYDSIDVGSYSSPEFADIDGDGDYDLFIGSEGRTYYYENIGTPEIPQFDYITDSYMIFEPGQRIQVVDINGDDAPDMIVGAGFYLTYTENTGTSTEPAFSFITNNFQNISRSAIKPCFVDIDTDGDYDLLAGEGVIPGPPTIALYRNEGTPTEPYLCLENENFITNSNFLVNANPCAADIDADGDYDLFVTTDDDYFFFYRNDGSPSNPDFTLVDSDWEGIGDYPGWRGMSFGDIDEDGDLDLLIQNVWQLDYGNIRFYRNQGTPQEADMVFETNVFLPGYHIISANPYLVDIDCDLDLDLFVGDNASGVSFFRNLEYNSVNREPLTVNRSFALLPNYPNPFNVSTMIPFTLDRQLPVKVVVYNQLGQVVWDLGYRIWDAGENKVVWNAEGCASGVYLIWLTVDGGQSMVKKVILIK